MRSSLTLWMVLVVLGSLVLAGFVAIVFQDRSVLANERSQLSTQAQTIASTLDSVQRANAFNAIAKIAGVTGVSLVPYDTSGRLVLGQVVAGTTAALPAGLTPSDLAPASVLAGTPLTGRSGNNLFAAVPTSNVALFATCKAGYAFVARSDRCVFTGSTAAARQQNVPSTTASGSTGRSGSTSKARAAAAAAGSPLVETPGNACPSCEGVLVVLTRQVDVSQRIISYFLLASGIALLASAIVAITISRRVTRPLRRAVETTRRIASGDLAAHAEARPSDYTEMTSLAHSLNAMVTTLRDARDLERNFLMSVSHDLRTPLTSIRGFAEAISEGAVDDNRRAAEVISSEARRLERLVGDLLDLAKLSAHSFSLDLDRVDVAALLRDAAEGFRPTLADAGLTLDLRVPPDTQLPVAADADRLAQVFANLVENAFTYASATVTVVAGLRDGYTVVGITDDGPGIPPDDLPHVFERLFTTKRAEARRAGTGLGLAIVAELCQAMGAAVRAESGEQAGGTTMVVTLRPWVDLQGLPGPSPWERAAAIP